MDDTTQSKRQIYFSCTLIFKFIPMPFKHCILQNITFLFVEETAKVFGNGLFSCCSFTRKKCYKKHIKSALELLIREICFLVEKNVFFCTLCCNPNLKFMIILICFRIILFYVNNAGNLVVVCEANYEHHS